MNVRNLKVFALAITLFSSLSVLMAFGSPKDEPVEKTVKILTVGNSFADNACTYLSQIAESVPGFRIEVTKANIGGCFLEKHVNLIKACEKDSALKPYKGKYSLKDLLKKDEYDFVTIQQVSHLSFKAESFQPYADELRDFIKQYAPNTTIIIHQTWAYSPTCKRYEELGISRDEMHKGLVKNYNTLAKRYTIDILPSGNAFYSSFKKNKDIDLWNAKDQFHANKNGCYLAGCVWFGKLFGISPLKIGFIPEGMTQKTAKYLQKVAKLELNKL